MQDTLIPSIIMAVITALAWIAYNHPKSYASMYPVLLGIWSVCFAAYFAYHIGYTIGFGHAKLEAVKLNHSLGLTLPEDESPSFAPSVFFIAAQIYLMILRYLPKMLNFPPEKLN
jgi:hypothetical protein